VSCANKTNFGKHHYFWFDPQLLVNINNFGWVMWNKH
jgi:hypothetical protein